VTPVWQGVSGCERMRSLLSLQADGELEEELEPILHAHLDACPTCRSWAAELAAIVRQLRASQHGTEPATGR
jgi:predicted anti-sigma-YlaC factor YlaD